VRFFRRFVSVVDGISRRSVLCAIAAAGLLSACGSSAPRRTGGVGSAKPGDRVAALADVPVGSGVLVDMPGNGQLLLVQPAAGQLRAFNPVCPHAGSVVNPPAGGAITCPTHNSKFDPATGQPRSGPSRTGLTEVPVKISGTDVLIG
jgi:nitrite reductase/ring-hydroxylating ferredoxin subunit